MKVYARKSDADFFQTTFGYPTHWKCIVNQMWAISKISIFICVYLLLIDLNEG